MAKWVGYVIRGGGAMQHFLESFEQSTDLLTRISGPAEAPVVVYLPGLHGDWTPMWRAQGLISRNHRLIEVAYPRSATDWTLDDYVARVEALLERLGVGGVHLLAESFGSLVGWGVCCRSPERTKTLMLAGGFCSTPGRLRVALGGAIMRLLPPGTLDRMVDLYLVYLIKRGFPPDAFRRDDFFPAARTRQGWLSARNRLKIIRDTDVRERLCELRLPVLYFGGAWDLIVPVRREIATIKGRLHPECCFQSVLYPQAPHAIIPARATTVAGLIGEWVERHEGAARRD